MSKVVLNASMSLDGFVTASRQTPEEPMGADGLRLFAWFMDGDEQDREVLQNSIKDVGAMITGRRTYDHSLPWWGADGPGGAARTPVFVLTHQPPADPPENGVYVFVTDGIQSALEQAKAAAAGQIISMGGANVARQFIDAGLVDEIELHVVPYLFGAGTALFRGLEDRHVQLERLEVIDTANAIHMRFKVVRD